MTGSDVTPEKLVQTLPEVSDFPIDQWRPQKKGEIAIYIDVEGVWFYKGSPFTRPKMVKLFSRLLRKEGDDFFLVTPVEKLQIRVEDAPFVVTHVDFSGHGKQQKVVFTTNVNDTFTLNAYYPMHVVLSGLKGKRNDATFIPYVRVRHALEARIHRNVFYQLAERAEQIEQQYGIWSSGSFWLLGPSCT